MTTHDFGAYDKSMTNTEMHTLTCNDAPLIRGARKERNWSCTCGKRFFGYDATAKREHKAHRDEAR